MLDTAVPRSRALEEVAARLAQVADGCDDRADHERATLQCLREALGFDVGFYVRNDVVGEARMGLQDGLVRASRRRVPLYGQELAPVLEVALARGLAVDREVLGERLHATRLYREFIAPHGGHSTALIPLRFRRRTLGLLALGRLRGGFSATEQHRLRALVPVLGVCDASVAQPDSDGVLTPRERDVLDYLCLGYSNPEIARACQTSVNTVRNQLQSVYRKLGASNRAEAVGIALRRGGP